MDATIGPELTRRQMFAAAGAVTLAAALPGLRRMSFPSLWPSSSGGTVGSAAAAPGGGLTLDRFAPHVGSDFAVTGGRLGAVSVTLDEAAAHQPSPSDRPGLTGEAFSLVFRGKGAGIPDGIHTVVHPVLGAFPLFVSPFGTGHKGQEYQAVVDRRVPTR